jgi:hypothetical protein
MVNYRVGGICSRGRVVNQKTVIQGRSYDKSDLCHCVGASMAIQLTTVHFQGQAAELDFSHVDHAEIDSIFTDIWAMSPRQGCAAGVTHHGELIISKGYGMANLDYGIPIAARLQVYDRLDLKAVCSSCTVDDGAGGSA